MKLTKKHMSKGFTLVELLVVIAIIAALAAMATPVIMKQKKKADMTTATNNAKQIFLLMVEIDDDLGGFPSDDTAASDADLNGYTGSNSNDYLGQFLAGGYVQSEEIFYAKAGSASDAKKKPDNVYNTKSKTLEAGECGFSYVKDQSSSGNSGIPLLMAPMDDTSTFKEDPYGGKCVVLRIDGSVQTLRLSNERKGKLPSGQTLFDTGDDSVWGDQTPEVVNAK
ncbi:hypothetical protein NT6N_25190 [Oceaniferula spumae]|uniref:Prepilin-type N-terminal cleavage/methylation domain-containing protein n=1 Tax=Oceaniferula spumae TaxID=2979115 RepID=A0AAT9FN98_9BACT